MRPFAPPPADPLDGDDGGSAGPNYKRFRKMALLPSSNNYGQLVEYAREAFGKNLTREYVEEHDKRVQARNGGAGGRSRLVTGSASRSFCACELLALFVLVRIGALADPAAVCVHRTRRSGTTCGRRRWKRSSRSRGARQGATGGNYRPLARPAGGEQRGRRSKSRWLVPAARSSGFQLCWCSSALTIMAASAAVIGWWAATCCPTSRTCCSSALLLR